MEVFHTNKMFFAILAGTILIIASLLYASTNDVNNSNNHLLITEVALATLDPKARWFELYNPTDESINLNNWSYRAGGCYAVFRFPNITVKPREYVVITPSIENFTNYWGVNNIDNIYQSMVPYQRYTYIWIIKGIYGVDESDIVDSMGEPPPRYILNHSWARYRGGYDTDNFTNDFYDEPNPTPGYENHRAKGESDVLYGYVLLIAVVAVFVVISIVIFMAWYERKTYSESEKNEKKDKEGK